MWQNFINGFLGLWVVLLGFLGLPASLSRILLVITGIIISVLSFWSTSAVSKAEAESSVYGADKNNSNKEV